jgi:hypothetical protein
VTGGERRGEELAPPRPGELEARRRRRPVELEPRRGRASSSSAGRPSGRRRGRCG